MRSVPYHIIGIDGAVVRDSNIGSAMSRLGHELPRQSQAGAAALLPKTDTKAKYQRGSGLMQRSNKPSYSITSSASESSMGDGSIPRARAVLRLRTKASLVGRCTGMSAGFSPRNMRAA